MHQELKDSRILTVTGNAKENAGTLYNGYNTARK